MCGCTWWTNSSTRCRWAPRGRSCSPGCAWAAATSTTRSAPPRPTAATRTGPGQRLYLAGDFGRWRPDGKLEFLGRRDSQVKISGFRIEIGEIENTLLRVPGVHDAAVVVTERAGRALPPGRLLRRPPGDPPAEQLAARLGESLPRYMVPATFHWRPTLPLTPNGKIDKKVLAAAAGPARPHPRRPRQSPATPTERRLATAWATVLGVEVEQIGRGDHFFDRGGSSLLAVKVAIALKREVSLKDLTRHPVLADLAALIDGRAERPTGLPHTPEMACSFSP